jgi:hypothetical protein
MPASGLGRLKGPLLEAGSPNPEALEALHALLFDERSFNAFANKVHDVRFMPEAWRDVFRFEALSLLRWGLLRAKNSCGRGYQASEGHTRFLCLLPGYGFALHVFRRAVPLAFLGINVTIATKPEVRASAELVVNAVGEALGITSQLKSSSATSEHEVYTSCSLGHPIILTGSVLTLNKIRTAHPSAILFAATGSCSVVLATNTATALSIESRKQLDRLPVSCSNHGVTLVASGFLAESLVLSVNGKPAKTQIQLRDALTLWHPSVVLAEQPGAELETLPHFISGYPVIQCEGGVGTTVENFGSDPLGGWIGDYRL